MENNNVFVDNQGNFYTVLNDNDFSYFELQLLQEEGFYFAYETLSSEGKENLLDEIKSLPLENQVTLLEILEAKANVDLEFRFSVENCKEEYIEWYGKFDKKDFEYWLQEEVLPDLFNDIDYHDIETICEYLMHYKKEFLFYVLRGNSQGDYCMVWNNQGKNTPITQEYLENVCFDSWINVFSSNEEGEPVDNLENVPGYYLDDYSNSENVYLNEYMKKNYNATLAKFDVVYHK